MSDKTSDKSTRKYSSQVVDGVEHAPSRAMLRAVGFGDEDFKRPQIGIASTWSMVTPCNMHINKLAEEVNRGVDAAQGKGIIYGTITVSDGISMGTEGMKYSLVSREVIADSIEAVSGCMGHDAVIAIGRGLGFPWSIAVIGLALPRCWRDWAYDFIAARRYRWFGRNESCLLPTPDLRARFLE